MAYIRLISGLYPTYIWVISGLYLTYIWLILDLYLAYIWLRSDLYPTYICQFAVRGSTYNLVTFTSVVISAVVLAISSFDDTGQASNNMYGH